MYCLYQQWKSLKCMFFIWNEWANKMGCLSRAIVAGDSQIDHLRRSQWHLGSHPADLFVHLSQCQLGSPPPSGQVHPRLLHTPNPGAVGLSVGYETWPWIGWCQMYRGEPHLQWILGTLQCIMGSWLVRIFTVFQRPRTPALTHSPLALT